MSIALAGRSSERPVRRVLGLSSARASLVRLLTATIPVLIGLVCPVRADEAFLYRQIRFGSALSRGRLAACSIQFDINFHDPRGSEERTDDVAGEIVFSRQNGSVSAVVTIRAFGDYTTKFTGIGDIGSVTWAADGTVLALGLPGSGVDQSPRPLQPVQAAALRTILLGDSMLAFTLSNPMRSFVLPFSLHSALPGGRTDDIAEAGLSTFADCMAVLDRAAP